jgi:hypothetical protein
MGGPSHPKLYGEWIRPGEVTVAGLMDTSGRAAFGMRWRLLDRLLASAIHEPSEGARFSLADRPRQRPCYSKTLLRQAAPIIIGVIHSGSENKAPLVYDLKEPLRSVVDRKILEFALSPTFTP